MHDSENQAARVEQILKNPVGYLERALKTLKFYHPSELVVSLHDLKDFGSSKAEDLLDQSTEEDDLMNRLPFGIFLQSLSGEERTHLRLTLRTFGIGDFKEKTVADVIAEIELKLEEVKK